jgi:hypothetical protein
MTKDNRLADAIFRILQSVQFDNPADQRELRAALRALEGLLSARGLPAEDAFEHLPEEAVTAIKRLHAAQPNEVAGLMRAFAGLIETGSRSAPDLERLTEWLKANVEPILSRGEHGSAAEARSMVEIRSSAKSVIAKAMRAQGLSPSADWTTAEAAPDTAASAGGMTRHRVFWRNFGSLAPSLHAFAAGEQGAEAARRQVAGLLASLDLPSRVTVRRAGDAAVLSFASPTTAAEAELLRVILAEAPLIEGWQVVIGEDRI